MFKGGGGGDEQGVFEAAVEQELFINLKLVCTVSFRLFFVMCLK